MELNKKEFGREYYDKYYANSDGYKLHYSELKYFDMWKEALSLCGRKIFEIGCGSGQFANLVIDNGRNYCGFDISREAVKIAISLGLDNAEFWVKDFRGFKIYPDNYDTYIAFEILEHVKDDRGLLTRIPIDKLVIFTVPTFDYKSHVRLFKNEKEILGRYADIIRIKRIKLFNEKWFLCHGNRRIPICKGSCRVP